MQCLEPVLIEPNCSSNGCKWTEMLHWIQIQIQLSYRLTDSIAIWRCTLAHVSIVPSRFYIPLLYRCARIPQKQESTKYCGVIIFEHVNPSSTQCANSGCIWLPGTNVYKSTIGDRCARYTSCSNKAVTLNGSCKEVQGSRAAIGLTF